MVKSSHVFFGWTNPTGDLRLPELGEQEQVSLHSLTALLCALYFCFLPGYRFAFGNLTRPPPDFVACVLGHT